MHISQMARITKKDTNAQFYRNLRLKQIEKAWSEKKIEINIGKENVPSLFILLP